VTQQLLEHERAGASAASVWRRRHAAYPPCADLSVRRDEARRDQLLAVEGTNRECGVRLVRSKLLERVVWTQDGLP
jgi:hypothetical protein